MSAERVHPVLASETAVDVYRGGGAVQPWTGGREAPPPPPPDQKVGRYLAALNRFKWLIALCVLLGGAGGYVATRFVDPEYEVQATIMMETMASGQNGNGGPALSNDMLKAQGWQDMLRSYAIIDPIVNQLALFVEPKRQADSTLFRSFRVAPRMRPGDYLLTITGSRYKLAFQSGIDVESGNLADSIGRPVGFQWQPGVRALAGRKSVAFRVQTPRETSSDLRRKLRLQPTEGSPLIFLNLSGPNSDRTAATLNAWVQQFVSVAKSTKTKNVTSLSRILEGRRQYAAENLAAAEAALQQFQVKTATEPGERQSAIAGIELTTNPAFDAFFRDKILVENYRHDRESIERVLRQAADTGGMTREALLSIPLIATDAAAENLRTALKEQADRESNLRRLQDAFMDENPLVVREKEALANLRRVTVPATTREFLAQLQRREDQLRGNIELSGRDLRGIPARTIEEQRLKRQVEAAVEMYRNLDMEASKARLAEASALADVSVMDSAVAPLKPNRNTAPMIIFGAIVAALGLAVVLAIVIDQFDSRFRYPEQASNDLGLFVLGVVPDLHAKGKRTSMEREAQAVEAFRSIRMNVRYAANPHRPFALTISSPGPNDGKSMTASNLALSFAESGARTLLIDGDLRRGELARTFGVAERPGLVEFLDGAALIAEVLHPVTAHPNLTLMPAGARRRRAPELLATPRLPQLVVQMAAEFDVVIIDSPPLGAGFDAYALATATGNLAVVLRAGATDCKMARAKLEVVDSLPVTVMGAVLNSIALTGPYRYYSYYHEYAAHDAPATERLGRPEPETARLTQEIG